MEEQRILSTGTAFLTEVCRKTADLKHHLTNNVVPDLFRDGDRPHGVGRDEPGEDGHRIFLYT